MATNSTESPTASVTPDINSFQNVMMFLCVTAIYGALVQGIAPKKLLKAIPQPIVVMVSYLIVGVILRTTRPADIDFGIRALVDPAAIQALFLPVLMFSELFRLNTRAFFIVLNQLLLLVGPGVVVGAILTAIFPFIIMPSRPLFDFNLSMAFGGMLATTDPIAIIICVNELAAPKRLAALVGGESLLNDGTSIVLVTLFLQLRQGTSVVAGQIVFFAFNQLFFSVLFGIAMGLASLLFIRIVRDDSSTLTTFVVSVPFLTFIVASYYFESSGVLSIIPLGVILNDFGRGMMMEHVEGIERLFDQLAFIATGWLYALSGFVVGEVIASKEISGVDWASLFVLYIWINLVRVVMVMMAYPVLKRTGYGFSRSEAVLLAFGGLRGAVGLTLALYIKADLKDDRRSGALIEFFMAGTILLMIGNGILTPFVLKRLGLASKPNEHMMEALQQKMAEECVDSLEAAGVDYDLAQYLAHGTEQQQIHMSQRRMVNIVSEVRDAKVEHLITKQPVVLSVLTEQRKHLVRAQRLMYEHLLKRKLINRGAWYMLDRAADAQLEENHFYLDQFKFVVDQVFKSKRYVLTAKAQCEFYDCIPGRVLLYLKNHGKGDIDEIMADETPYRASTLGSFIFGRSGETNSERGEPTPVLRGTMDTPSSNVVDDVERSGKKSNFTTNSTLGQSSRRRRKLNRQKEKLEETVADDDSEAWFPGLREAGSRATGVSLSPEEWLYNFSLASWGFILAQQDSIKLVDEMLTVSTSVEAFPNERRALKTEIRENCALPAKLIDAVSKYAPKVLARIKRLHALSEARNKLFGTVAQLNSHGILERNELKRLLKFAEKGLKRIQNCDFELQAPTIVGEKGSLIRENPNFFPFFRQNRIAQATVTASSNPPSEHDSQAGSTLQHSIQPQEQERDHQLPIHRQSGFGRTRVVPRGLPRRKIERRRSFSDFNLVEHCLEDGTDAVWKDDQSRASSLHRPTSATPMDEDVPLPDLIMDSILPMDVSRLMDVLKLDDANLKRY